jgi:hypothetical protein
MIRAALLTVLSLLFSLSAFAQSDTEVYKITSPVQALEDQLGAPSDSAEPYKSGLITPEQAVGILTKLQPADTKVTTIIHILRWKDELHTQTTFQKWYLYDPTPSKLSFYLQSKEQVFERTAIPGRKDFQFVYIHLNANLANGSAEWSSATAAGTALKHAVSYSVTVTKQQTQFIQDLQTILQIVGAMKPASLTVQPGYYSVSTFQSQWTTSSISIVASLDSGNNTKGSDTQKTASNQLASNTYTNEKPTWVGFSAGVPITSYKSITYESSSGTLVPNSITQQNVYLFLDGYLPPVLPSLWSFRYLPHPFFGVPLKGEVFRHTMFGVGIGLHWVEPFGGVVFDTQNQQLTGQSVKKNGVTLQAVFGIKISVSAVAKALKK